MTEHEPAADAGRFVLYNHDSDELATTQVFRTYGDAADAIDARLADVIVLQLRLEIDAGDEEAPPATEGERCECEQAGTYHSGVPGIVARVVGGRLVSGTAVERCDSCERYPTDQAALEKLRELGMVADDYREEQYCPMSSNGDHTADPASAAAADGAGRNRGTDWLIDFTCRHCGRSGSVRIEPVDIQWD